MPPPALDDLAAWAAAAVAAAEAPAPYSARDGRLLRLVPSCSRLAPHALAAQLRAALERQPVLLDAAAAAAAAGAAKSAPPRCTPPAARPRSEPATSAAAAGALAPPAAPRRASATRHMAALLRGWAYLGAGDADQALRDARAALAAAPRRATATLAAASPPASLGGGGSLGAPAASALTQATQEPPPPPLTGLHACAWAPAHDLAGAAHAALEDWTNAALHARIACDLLPAQPALAARLAAALPRLPPAHAAALAAGGAAGLVARVAAEAEERLPEFLRPRPKASREAGASWHHYRAWTAGRIAALWPGLPPPLVSKLLEGDAGELDFRIRHPAALDEQVQELLGVLQSGGPAALAAHSPAPLTWERARGLAGPAGAVGLPLGYEAPPLADQEPRRAAALLGAAAEAGPRLAPGALPAISEAHAV
ncbi:hypothetical protein Rsub_13184 [Raphidocelis subcapitata]|uniref:Uncharacterized protein n=1 Tax=Raphidocelis subcapitata TaxID=307507 RepID=A0A2V0PN10_9CHLO|nr:hypothetical protein Rsub_13184 [Raphidocelis subcapitata]|eukprot:GBG00493.1 hypothetical protein Rsub_13184 [Raphidocelis subcapitata]